jgi:hypothetical protein
LVIFISTLFVLSSYSSATSISPETNAQLVSADSKNQVPNITKNTAIITQIFYLSDQFAVYGEPSSSIVIDVEIYIVKHPATNPILSVPYFGQIKAIRNPSFVSYKYGQDVWGHNVIEFNIPRTTNYAKISVEYVEKNLLSIMYRNYMKIYYAEATIEFIRIHNLSYAVEYYMSFILPIDAEFLYGFPWGVREESTIRYTEHELTVRVNNRLYLHIAYQPNRLKIYSTLLSLPALLIIPFLFISTTQRFFRRSGRKITRSAIYKKFTYMIHQIQPMRYSIALYILTTMLMISLSVSVGPNPDATIVVIADNVDEISNEIHENHPNAKIINYWSIQKRLNQLRDVRQIDMFIVGYHPNPAQFIVDDIIVSSESGIRLIILEEQQDTPLASAIIDEFNLGRGDNLKIVSLRSVDGQVDNVYKERRNLHRLYRPSSELFIETCSIIAFLSLLHFYAAGMVVTASATPPSTKPITEVFLQAIITTFAVFSFSMISLFSVGRLLTVLPSAHAAAGVVDGYPITLVGYLPSLPPPFPSFGGGNLLRAAFSALGVVSIILINHNNNIIKLDFTLFVCLLGGLGVLAVSPYFGPFIIGLAVVFVTSGIGPVSGTPRILAADISLFLVTFSRFLEIGNISRGIMLFFASVVPLTITRKLSRRIRTPVYIIMIPLLARGLMRLGEMNPYTLINSAIPGLFFGIALSAIFLLVNAAAYTSFRAILRLKQYFR